MNKAPRLSASAMQPEKLGFMSRMHGLAQKMRWLFAGTLLMGTVAGCAEEKINEPDVCQTDCEEPGQTTDTTETCEDVALDCGDHGMCVEEDGEALCGCDSGYAGDDCSDCADGFVSEGDECVPDTAEPFDPSNFMAYKQFDAGEGGRVEVAGQTGADARYNGYYVDIEPGSFSAPTWVLLTPAVGANVPTPSSGTLQTASGIEVLALPVGEEYTEGGEFNEQNPDKPAPLLFAGHRGTVVYFNTTQSALEENIPFSMKANGTEGEVPHFSPFYTVDNEAQMNAAVTEGVSMGEFYIDFTGTQDEGTDELLDYELNTTAGTITRVNDKLFKFNLPVGQHKVTATVLDQFGQSIATQQYNLNVEAPIILDDVDVNCAPNAITTGETADCDATAYYSDSTNTTVDEDCSWNAVTGTVDSTGLYTPDAFDGVDEVSCTYGGMTGSDNVDVSAVITDVTVVCNPALVRVGENSECDATATWSDGVTTPEDDNCTWSAVTGAVDGTGLYTAPSTSEISTSPTTDTVECDLGVDGVGEASVEVTAETPSAWNLDAGCGGGDCPGNQDFNGTFTYSGDITSTAGWCTMTSGTPGTISNIQLDGNGNGTFDYHSSNQFFADETIHIQLEGPAGTTTVTTTHQTTF